jgi:hypothetical protein
MAFLTVAGSTLSVAAALPTAQTAVAFAALTWIPVGELTDVPTVLGREYNIVTHSPVSSAQITEKKGSYKLPQADAMCAWDDDDAGQLLIKGASESNDIVSFKLEKQDGAIRYFTAQVSKFTEENGTVDNVVTGSFSMLRQTNTITVAAV